jgi:ketosteroid isomerase-like protein
MSLEPYETIEAVDDQLLVLTIFRACGRDSGVELEVPEQHLWAFRDGKVVRLAWFHDERAARRAAGLR